MDMHERPAGVAVVEDASPPEQLPGDAMIGAYWAFVCAIPVGIVYLMLMLSLFGDVFSIGGLIVPYFGILAVIFFYYSSLPAFPTAKGMVELRERAEANGRRLADERAGRPMQVWVGDVEFPPSNKEFVPTGLGWDGERLHLLAGGRLASFPPHAVRSWRTFVDPHIPNVSFTYTNVGDKMVAQAQAQTEALRQELEARRRSGLFVHVRDMAAPQWRVESTDGEKLAQMHEMLSQVVPSGDNASHA